MTILLAAPADVEVAAWADRVRTHLRRTVESIVAAGLELVEAKAALGHGRFEAMVRGELGMDPRTARRFMDVATHAVLSNRSHVSDLPASWGTLAELARLSGPDLEAAIEAGEVRPDMERREAQQLVRRYLDGDKGTPALNGSCDPDLLAGTYPTIVADPPWRYGNTSTRGAAEDHYSTMTVDDLCELPVIDLTPDKAHLYLWVTNGFLREGFTILDAWGFTYKTALTWVKPQMGMGNYFRGSTEHVLFGVKGGLGTATTDTRNVFESPRGRHSAKPEAFYALVERQSPGPYLEMFARQRRMGWNTWGAEG